MSREYKNLDRDPEYRTLSIATDLALAGRYREKAAEIRHQLTQFVDLSGAEILDTGCGRGAYGRLLVGESGSVVGVDVNFTELELAAEAAHPKASYLLASGMSLPFPDKHFDLVLSRHTIEHLPKPLDFLFEAKRVLKTGGVLYLSTPNRHSISLLSSRDGRCWLLRKWFGVEKGVFSIFTLEGLVSLAQEAGFERVTTLPIPGMPEKWSRGPLQKIRPSHKLVLETGP